MIVFVSHDEFRDGNILYVSNKLVLAYLSRTRWLIFFSFFIFALISLALRFDFISFQRFKSCNHIILPNNKECLLKSSDTRHQDKSVKTNVQTKKIF